MLFYNDVGYTRTACVHWMVIRAEENSTYRRSIVSLVIYTTDSKLYIMNFIVLTVYHKARCMIVFTKRCLYLWF